MHEDWKRKSRFDSQKGFWEPCGRWLKKENGTSVLVSFTQRKGHPALPLRLQGVSRTWGERTYAEDHRWTSCCRYVKKHKIPDKTDERDQLREIRRENCFSCYETQPQEFSIAWSEICPRNRVSYRHTGLDGIGKMEKISPILLQVALKEGFDGIKFTFSGSWTTRRTVLKLLAGPLALLNVKYLVADM